MKDENSKEDLQYVATEMGIKKVSSMTTLNLKKAISSMKNYEKECIKTIFAAAKESEKRMEESEYKRKEELQICHEKQRERRRPEELVTQEGNEKVEEMQFHDSLAPKVTQTPRANDGQTALK
ncbi:hypothetical protein NPIL_372621 [Nephila pilipes]|uniref:Uncharacterized protein n=1 Tax=Nephila pilipes TaxID=299642 RepID=A0A8X6QC57_NEPPI|nr:hypothetical protein NPIL_372621 [Nephila pilipes]